jgi:hypothetical protein
MNELEHYIKNVAVALDELGNAAVLLGDPSETISSHVGKAAKEGKIGAHTAELIVNWIMRNPQHCQTAIEPDRGAGAIIPD